MMRFNYRLIAVALAAFLCRFEVRSETLQVGFDKVDITPNEPLRLSGYAVRDVPFEGIEQRLFARAMAIKTETGDLYVLSNIDAIGVPGTFTAAIARRLEQAHRIDRARFVLCVTHSHTAPQVSGYAPNVFRKPLSDEEQQRQDRYSARLADLIVTAVDRAIANCRPSRLFFGQGRATFAVNRRVLANGKWTGFGVYRDGPVDHSLPILKVVGIDGTLHGVVFNYACHCTTLGPSFNRVCGDWAGYAQEALEEQRPGVVAMSLIGCGADANPEPRGGAEVARIHGHSIAAEVNRLLAAPLREITATPDAAFGYAGLAIDRPTTLELGQRLTGADVHAQRHAKEMLAVHERMGRLPESYPCPIHVWRFGDALTMVYLGGEVVVDYALRLKKELSGAVWITAYADDVFGYVASERMREEGGYEVDFSMIYYNQPGRWSSGTEETLIRRVHELARAAQFDQPHSASAALKTIRTARGFDIDQVASEPLVADPVNIAFGDDGRLWVVEMGDYPRGTDGKGAPGGRVKILTDVDGDGRFDRATTFLDGLRYPTSVMPWRDGVLVAAAPEIFFAQDSDADGKADRRQVLFTGFLEANPQHRVHGFAFGLDNWLYIGGDNLGQIRSAKTGAVVGISGRDARIRPEEGILEPVSGQSQFIRCRDDWGNWFGNNNSLPLAHFVLPDQYLRRNPYVEWPSPRVELLQPPNNPPVFPASRTIDRFNDLHTANRFTSACSPEIYRDERFGPDFRSTAFVCEPVHNLVHRIVLERRGLTFVGRRHPADSAAEFVASTDNWFRPVRAVVGPDGALWIVDMYRHVIEHPEWIPEVWQERLDLRAGHDKGRIYRVFPNGCRPGGLPSLRDKNVAELVDALGSPNGWTRDTAQRLLVHGNRREAAEKLERLARAGPNPNARVHAMCTLDGLGAIRSNILLDALKDSDPQVRAHAVRLSEPMLSSRSDLAQAITKSVYDSDIRVRFQAALSLGACDSPIAGEALGKLAAADVADPWIRAAVLSSATGRADRVLSILLATATPSTWRDALTDGLIRTAMGPDDRAGAIRILSVILPEITRSIERWQMSAVITVLEALDRKNLSVDAVVKSASGNSRALQQRLGRVIEFARQRTQDATSPVDERVLAVRILGIATDDDSGRRQLLDLLRPQTVPELQSAAVQTLARWRSPQVPAVLLAGWSGHVPARRAQILDVLMSRLVWTQELLNAMERRVVTPDDLDAAHRQRLLQHPRDEVRNRAAALLGAAATSRRADVLRRYSRAFELAGDVVTGGETFARRCATCHRFRELGAALGPDLGALKDKSPQALLEGILDPNKAVESKYRGYTAATKDGRVVSGMIVEETGTNLTLAREDGKNEVILRADLEDLRASGFSFMPEGLEKDLSIQDVANVIRYVQDQPLLTPGRVANNAKSLIGASDSQGVIRVIESAGLYRQPSFLGPIDMSYCRATDGKSRVVWQAAPKAMTARENGEVTYRFAVGCGYFSQPAAAFRLVMNGRHLLDLSSGPGDNYATSADGRVHAFFFAAQSNSEDSTGILLVTMPKEYAPDDGLAKFEVTGPAAGSMRWFGVLHVDRQAP
jgi:putative membrane-bound dehydrogenase-like protein